MAGVQRYLKISRCQKYSIVQFWQCNGVLDQESIILNHHISHRREWDFIFILPILPMYETGIVPSDGVEVHHELNWLEQSLLFRIIEPIAMWLDPFDGVNLFVYCFTENSQGPSDRIQFRNKGKIQFTIDIQIYTYIHISKSHCIQVIELTLIFVFNFMHRP